MWLEEWVGIWIFNWMVCVIMLIDEGWCFYEVVVLLLVGIEDVVIDVG